MLNISSNKNEHYQIYFVSLILIMKGRFWTIKNTSIWFFKRKKLWVLLLLNGLLTKIEILRNIWDYDSRCMFLSMDNDDHVFQHKNHIIGNEMILADAINYKFNNTKAYYHQTPFFVTNQCLHSSCSKISFCCRIYKRNHFILFLIFSLSCQVFLCHDNNLLYIHASNLGVSSIQCLSQRYFEKYWAKHLGHMCCILSSCICLKQM